MPISAEQKATIGNAYIAEIKRRIEVRSKAKALLPELKTLEGVRAECIPSVARLVKRLCKNASDVLVVNLAATVHRSGPNAYVVDVAFKVNGKPHTVCFDKSLVPEVKAYEEHNAAVTKKKGDLCRELSFLNSSGIAPSTVSGFQSHAARLLNLAKDVDPTKPALALVDDYLTSRRGFTCDL